MYVLPDAVREDLKTPLGPVVSGSFRSSLGQGPIATVGDVVTEQALVDGVLPQLMVIDGKTKRTRPHELPKLPPSLRRVPVKNPAARITDQLWQAVAAAYAASSCTLIEVDGEEDLATLPAIVHAPAGAQVVYGQPDEGAVIVTVDQTTRRRALALLAHMEVV